MVVLVAVVDIPFSYFYVARQSDTLPPTFPYPLVHFSVELVVPDCHAKYSRRVGGGLLRLFHHRSWFVEKAVDIIVWTNGKHDLTRKTKKAKALKRLR